MGRNPVSRGGQDPLHGYALLSRRLVRHSPCLGEAYGGARVGDGGSITAKGDAVLFSSGFAYPWCEDLTPLATRHVQRPDQVRLFAATYIRLVG